MALTGKRRLFVEHYIEAHCNGAEAARRAGYAEKSAHVEANRLLKDEEVQAAISERVAAAAMGADEVLVRLAEQARGEIAAFINVKGRAFLDLKAVQKAGKMHLVKGISYTKSGDPIIQTYDAQAALVQLGRHHKLFTDSLDQTTNGEKMTPTQVNVHVTGSLTDAERAAVEDLRRVNESLAAELEAELLGHKEIG